MITMYAGIRTFCGITFLKAEITMFEHMRTIEAEMPMPIALETEVVVARVGQVPSTRRRTGFSMIKPLVSSLPKDFFSAIS